MISFWEGGGKGRSYEIGSNHPSIKEKQEWTRQLSSIKIDEDSDEVESIADMMLREVESQRIEQQFGCKKFDVVVWSRNETEEDIQKRRGEL